MRERYNGNTPFENEGNNRGQEVLRKKEVLEKKKSEGKIPEKKKSVEKKVSQEIEKMGIVDNFLREVVAKDFIDSEDAYLDGKGHVLPRFFSGVYPIEEIMEDEEGVNGLENNWFGEKLVNAEVESGGEDLEKLATILFFKYFNKNKKNFNVYRSAKYDDIKFKVDQIIISKEESDDKNDAEAKIFGVFDYTKDLSHENLLDKISIINKINVAGGTKTKYAFIYERKESESTEKEEKNMELKLNGVENIPLFLIAIDDDRVTRAINNFKNNPEEMSESELEVFLEMVEQLKVQVNSELFNGVKNPIFKKRLAFFKKFLENMD